MRQRILLSAAVASLLAASGCQAPTPVTTQSTPQTAIASSQLSGTLSTPSVIAVGGGNVIAVGGGNVIATGGGNVIAVGGGNVIATGGGNVIATGGGNVIATGGGNYEVLQAEGETVEELLLAQATVYLADGAGQPYENATAVTDDTGRFTFNDVPGGGTYQVVVDLKLPDGKTYSLRTLASATEETVTASVDTTTTLVAESLLDGQELGDLDNAGFRSGVEKAKARLTRADLPDNWTDRAAVKKAAGTAGERFREFFAEVRAKMRATVRTKLTDWKSRIQERFRSRKPAPQPSTAPVASPDTTPSSPAPTAGLKARKLKLAPGFRAYSAPLEIKLIARSAEATEIVLAFDTLNTEVSVELLDGMTYDVRVRSKASGTAFRPRGSGLVVPAEGGDQLLIPFL